MEGKRKRRAIYRNKTFFNILTREIEHEKQAMPPKATLGDYLTFFSGAGLLGMAYMMAGTFGIVPMLMWEGSVVKQISWGEGLEDYDEMSFTDETTYISQYLNPSNEVLCEITGINDIAESMETGRLCELNLVFLTDVPGGEYKREMINGLYLMRFSFVHSKLNDTIEGDNIKNLVNAILSHKGIFNPQPSFFVHAYTTIYGREILYERNDISGDRGAG